MGSAPVSAGAAGISAISGGAAKNASSGGGSGMGGASSAMGMKRGTAFPSASAGAFHEESGRAHIPSPFGVSGQG